MKTFFALFRGINVGGNNILPMKKLTVLFEELGFINVITYIQSGNVLFHSKAKDSSGFSKKISSGVKKQFGFEPWILILEISELVKAIESNPFPESESEPKSLHLFFLSSLPKNPDLKKIESIKGEKERFKLENNVFYLHAPDGIGRSKLAASIEKLLGVPITGRNWRTVSTLLEMAKEFN
jgi:uncharacterized protein (DUF1697 family)